MIKIKDLKKKYPHPVKAIDAHLFCDYCVGGAICHEMGIERDFPDSIQLKDAILKANKRIDLYALKESEIDWFRFQCEGIIAANDIGNFDLAWSILGKLLRWKPEVNI